MKTKLVFTFIVGMLLTQVTYANDHKVGQQLFQASCASCHGTAGGMDMNKRVAPPIVAVRMHYISTYADKDSFVMAVADWVENRDADNSMMRGAIRRFGLMPAVKVTRNEAEKIAAYIYDGDIEKPEGFQQHFEERHGKKKNR
ncbi:MAG: cytochrome c [Gammaproteobacteria bacterium]|nr:cytochrome c [Gammaproteobacteria bacterium]